MALRVLNGDVAKSLGLEGNDGIERARRRISQVLGDNFCRNLAVSLV